jgi:hypothetical protein
MRTFWTIGLSLLLAALVSAPLAMAGAAAPGEVRPKAEVVTLKVQGMV